MYVCCYPAFNVLHFLTLPISAAVSNLPPSPRLSRRTASYRVRSVIPQDSPDSRRIYLAVFATSEVDKVTLRGSVQGGHIPNTENSGQKSFAVAVAYGRLSCMRNPVQHSNPLTAWEVSYKRNTNPSIFRKSYFSPQLYWHTIN